MKRIFSVALLTLFSMSVVFAQLKVTGKVTDSKTGEPISYATVAVKGASSVGTQTDDNGNYTITMPQGSTTLVFIFIGYATQEVAVGNRSTINVALVPDAIQLEETIVVAYGVAKKSTYTGAAAVVRAEAIKDAPNVSFQNALTGKVAGLQVTTNSGQAGSTPTLRLRGIGSVYANNEPLYVIDGVPVISGSQGQLMDGNIMYSGGNNAMSSINPNDIESITVLKDAAASALYGSRAANGVIIVQTKRGKQGKAKIDFRASYGFSNKFATDNFERATDEQNLEMFYETWYNGAKFTGSNDVAANLSVVNQLNSEFNDHGYWFYFPTGTNTTGTTPGSLYGQLVVTDHPIARDRRTGESNGEATGPSSGRLGKYFDWEKALLRTATYQTYDVAVSGASETNSYYTSLSYTEDAGKYLKNDYNRVAGRLNLTQKLGKFAEISSAVNVSKSKQTGFNDSRNNSTNIFMQLRNLLWGFYWPTRYEDDSPYTARYSNYAQNNLYYKDTWDAYTNTLRLSAIETLTVNLLKELKFKTTLSFDNSQTLEHVYYSPEHFSYVGDVGAVHDYSTNAVKIVSSSILDYNKTFAGKHNVSLLAGFEAEQNRTDYMRASGKNFPNSLQVVHVTGVRDATAYYWQHNMMSILSRAEYNYDSKYYLSGSYRRDGSSRFGSNTRWGDFWSVAGSWRITNEGFMKGIDYLSNLRLRASYGVNGTLPEDDYGHLALIGFSTRYMGNSGGYIINAPNKDLSWEESHTYNFALEFGLFQNRLTGTVEYFNRDSKTLILDVPISMVIGIPGSYSLGNIGEINNHGWEIELAGDVIKTRDFAWNMGITASAIKNKTTKLYKDQDILWWRGPDSDIKTIYRVGYSTLSVYGREWAGVKADDKGFIRNVWYLNNDTDDDPYREMVKDEEGNLVPLLINGRPATFDYSKAKEGIIGKIDPDLYGGINSNFHYKDFALDLGFIYKLGGKLYDRRATIDVNEDGYYNARLRSRDQYVNRSTDGNPGKYPQLILDTPDVLSTHSTRHLHDATFLRLKNLTFSYNLPKNLIQKVQMANARLYFNAANLWTWAAYKEADPEVGADGYRSWAMPLNKTFTFGVEISF